MKIPNKIRIDGEDWAVISAKNLMLDEGNWGECNHIRREIKLDKDSVKKPTTLLHELIHVISENANLDLKENQVKRLAHGIYAIIKDNKLNFNE